MIEEQLKQLLEDVKELKIKSDETNKMVKVILHFIQDFGMIEVNHKSGTVCENCYSRDYKEGDAFYHCEGCENDDGLFLNWTPK